MLFVENSTFGNEKRSNDKRDKNEKFDSPKPVLHAGAGVARVAHCNHNQHK